MTVQNISAVTLAVRDMAVAVEFYGGKVGLEMLYGGGDAAFTSFRVGGGYINLILEEGHEGQLVGEADPVRGRRGCHAPQAGGGRSGAGRRS